MLFRSMRTPCGTCRQCRLRSFGMNSWWKIRWTKDGSSKRVKGRRFLMTWLSIGIGCGQAYFYDWAVCSVVPSCVPARDDVSFLGKSRCTCRPADLMYSYSTARYHRFCKLYHTSSFMFHYACAGILASPWTFATP